ncbi:MAG: hypothetical protein EHM43_05135 [Ignavibacteriae bacterium]|nr:MAG: hypothetical protein EHM43_05135 [Ignavibacteriota bacterium]
MQSMKWILTAALLSVVVISGCSRKATPTPIESLKVIKDDVRMFEVKVPSNWRTQTIAGELVLATSKPTIARRFLDFSKGDGGAKVELRAIPVDSTRNIDSLIKNSKLEFEDGLDRYELTDVQLGGKPAKLLHVTFDQEDGEFESNTYFAENDSVITILTLAAFGRTYEDYQAQFEEIVASVKLAQRPMVVERKQDTLAPQGPEPPSDTLRPYSASEFAIQIPQNFQGQKSNSNGLTSVNFFGSRLDCNIQVDVFDASKQKNLDKILDQNKPNYGGGKANMTTLGGVKAGYFSYNPTASVSSRAYFAVSGNRLFRFTVNWYKPEQSVYLPIFEKSLKTVAFK